MMVLTALIMSVLAIFAGGTMAAVTLYGANQEGRRAADLDALSAAASLPTANLTACNTDICNPVHLPTGNQFCPPPSQGIGGRACSSLGTVDLNQSVPLPNTNWTVGSCNVAGQQFDPGHSPIQQVFTISGKPIWRAICAALPGSETGCSVPGTTGMPVRIANWRAAVLSPRRSSSVASGPMKVIPASAQARANAGFSERKP